MDGNRDGKTEGEIREIARSVAREEDDRLAELIRAELHPIKETNDRAADYAQGLLHTNILLLGDQSLPHVEGLVPKLLRANDALSTQVEHVADQVTELRAIVLEHHDVADRRFAAIEEREKTRFWITRCAHVVFVFMTEKKPNGKSHWERLYAVIATVTALAAWVLKIRAAGGK